MWPRFVRAKGSVEAKLEVEVAGGHIELSPGHHLVITASATVTAALCAVFSLTLPYLSVSNQALGSAYVRQFTATHGRELPACLVGLLFAHLTGFDPLNIAQLIDPPHLGPADILARWIYLPVLALISLLLSLPNHFGASFRDPFKRRLLAAGAALASLLYIVLLLAYPVDSGLGGACACQFDWARAWDVRASLRIGFYVTLVLGVCNVAANELAGVIERVQWSSGAQDRWTHAVFVVGMPPPPASTPTLDAPLAPDAPPAAPSTATPPPATRPPDGKEHGHSLLEGYLPDHSRDGLDGQSKTPDQPT